MKSLRLLPALALACGCTPMLPTPPVGSHAGEASVIVPYPPPAARVDLVPDRPADMLNPAWVDGQWSWHGSRWVWEAGSWVDLRTLRLYAPPALVYLSDGNLHWFAGSFRGP